MLPSLFAKLATCVDPFIYTLNQPRIRKEILRRLHLLLPPAPINPSVLGENPYYCNKPTDGPNSRRSNNCNDNNNSSRQTGSQQHQIAGQHHRRSITTSNNTRRAQPCSSLIGRVIIEENIIGPVIITNADNDLIEPIFNNLPAGDDVAVSPSQPSPNTVLHNDYFV